MPDIPAREGLEVDKKEIRFDVTKQDYQTMFASISGQRVLAHLLVEYHFFQEIETPEEIAERNVLIRLLRNAGVLQQKNAGLLVQKLIDIGRIMN